MFNKLISLTRSEGLRSATIVTIGNIASTGISAVAMILFSRYLGPEQFGIFSALFSLLLILSKVGDLGINISLQRYIANHIGKEKEIKAVSQTASAVKLYIALGMAILGLLFGSWLGLYALKLPGESVWLVSLVFSLSGLVIFYEHVNSILQGRRFFGLSVLTNFVQSSGKLIVGLLLYITKLISIVPVVLLYLFMPLLGSLFSLIKLPLSYLQPKMNKKALNSIVSVAKWTSIAMVSATLADNLDVLIIKNFMTSYDTGIWSAAVRIATVASLVGWSLGVVLNVRVASYKHKHHLDSYLKKAILLSLLSLLGISALVLLSPLAIHYTVGIEFMSAVTPLNLLFISTAIMTATSPFVALFYLFDKPHYFAVSGVLSTVVLLLGDYLLIPSYGLTGAGYSRILTRVAVIIYTLYMVKKSYAESYTS